MKQRRNHYGWLTRPLADHLSRNILTVWRRGVSDTMVATCHRNAPTDLHIRQQSSSAFLGDAGTWEVDVQVFGVRRLGGLGRLANRAAFLQSLVEGHRCRCVVQGFVGSSSGERHAEVLAKRGQLEVSRGWEVRVFG